LRDAHGERRYPKAQVDRLRLVAHLLEGGFRPARVVPLSIDALGALSTELRNRTEADRPVDLHAADVHDFLVSIHDADPVSLRRKLGQAQARIGPVRFVTDIVVPLNMAVGRAWLDGRLQIFHEHIYTEEVQRVMRHALGNMPAASPDAAPRVLLATLPGEPHALGLLMAETLMAVEGCGCVSLGLQTPVCDVMAAAAIQKADIVALSCSGCVPAAELMGDLTELRHGLDPKVELWAGGGAQALQRRRIEGVRPMATLASIATEVRRRRDQRRDEESSLLALCRSAA
jgi:methanogenic corrinoid protein MtbC1